MEELKYWECRFCIAKCRSEGAFEDHLWRVHAFDWGNMAYESGWNPTRQTVIDWVASQVKAVTLSAATAHG
jgi:hypothetical protein